MPPFDLSYSGEDLLHGSRVPDRLVTRRQPDGQATATRHPDAPSHNPQTAQAARGYLLIDQAHLLQGQPLVAMQQDQEGMRTASYTEYLLQVLDKNSTMSSILFIICYAGLLHIL